MATQSDLKRKASARKGQATQKRNEASRSRDTAASARSRVEAERQEAAARAFTAARAIDVTLGGAEAARHRVTDSLRNLSDPRELLKRRAEDARQAIDRFESRGATTRRRLERDARRRAREVRDRVPV